MLGCEAVLIGETAEHYPEPKPLNLTFPLSTLKVEFLLFSLYIDSSDAWLVLAFKNPHLWTETQKKVLLRGSVVR